MGFSDGADGGREPSFEPDLEFVPDPGGVERLDGGALPLPSWLGLGLAAGSWLPLLISFMMSAAEAAPPPWLGLGVGVGVEVGVGL